MNLARACALLLVCCAGVPAMADEAESVAAPSQVAAPTFVAIPLVAIERQGYAFDYPRVLSQQRLFGIQHGVGLLAAACAAVPAQAEAVASAYTAWRARQQDLLDSLQHELAEFYFGPRAAEVSPLHIVRALNLREQLALTPDSAAAACASLPQALSLPRYDLTSSFALDEAQAATLLAVRANTQTEKCRELVPELAETLDENFKAWQARNDDAAKQAQLNVSELWLRTARAGSADLWLQAVSKQLATPAPAACKQLPLWLAAEASSLASSFQPPPLPVALETLLPADAPSAITSAVTLPLTQAPVVEVPVVTTPALTPPLATAPVAAASVASMSALNAPAVTEAAAPVATEPSHEPAAALPAAPEVAVVEAAPPPPPAALEAPPSMPADESELASTLLYVYELLMSVLNND